MCTVRMDKLMCKIKFTLPDSLTKYVYDSLAKYICIGYQAYFQIMDTYDCRIYTDTRAYITVDCLICTGSQLWDK